MKKEKKQPLRAAKFFRRLTASLILLLLCAVLKSYSPDVFSKVNSALSYTPDFTEISEYVTEFLKKH